MIEVYPDELSDENIHLQVAMADAKISIVRYNFNKVLSSQGPYANLSDSKVSIIIVLTCADHNN